MDKKTLRANIAKSAYNMGKYNDVIKNTDNIRDSNSYLMRGNAYIKLAFESNDFKGFLENYENALKEYEEGIRKFPGEKELVYNYEFIKQSLEISTTEEIDLNSNESKDKKNDNNNNSNGDMFHVLNMNEQIIIKRNLHLGNNKGNEKGNDW